MTIKGMPFDAKQNSDGTYDRVVYSQDIADYFGYLTSNGILLKRGQGLVNQLKVTYDGITTNVDTGVAMIEGRRAEITEAETLTHEVGGSSTRYDLIVLELNLLTTERCFKVKIVSFSTIPTSSDLVRTPTIYQLGLAYATVNAGSTSIASVTDLREDSSMCGISYVNVPDEAKILSIVSPQVIFDSEKYGSSIVLEKDSSNNRARGSYFASFILNKNDFPIWGAKRCVLTIDGLSSNDQFFCTPQTESFENDAYFTLMQGSILSTGYKAKRLYKQYVELSAESFNEDIVTVTLNLDMFYLYWTSNSINDFHVNVPDLNVELKKIEVYYY